MFSNSGSIFQSSSGNMSGNIQAAIAAEGNIAQTANSDKPTHSNELDKSNVISLFKQVEESIISSNLPEKSKTKVLPRIEICKLELEEENVDKQEISKNLEKITEVLAKAELVVNSSDNILKKTLPIIAKIVAWLGPVASSLQNILPTLL